MMQNNHTKNYWTLLSISMETAYYIQLFQNIFIFASFSDTSPCESTYNELSYHGLDTLHYHKTVIRRLV